MKRTKKFSEQELREIKKVQFKMFIRNALQEGMERNEIIKLITEATDETLCEDIMKS